MCAILGFLNAHNLVHLENRDVRLQLQTSRCPCKVNVLGKEEGESVRCLVMSNSLRPRQGRKACQLLQAMGLSQQDYRSG